MEADKVLNRKLVEHFGTDYDSCPRFRLKWSNYTEKRINESYEITEVPKYSYIIDRFVIEHHRSDQKFNQEIVVSDHYEPIWTFTAKSGGFYYPSVDDCIFVIKKFIDIITRVESQRKTASMIDAEEKSSKQEEENRFYDMLQQESSFLTHQLHGGEAVGYRKKES